MPTVSTATLQDEVLTGEAVALDLQPVGFIARSVGALIDVAMMVVIFVVVATLLSRLHSDGVLDDQTRTIATIASIVIIGIALPTAIETATRGRSLGKLIMGGRIVRQDGGSIGFRHAFLRALVGAVEIIATAGTLALLTGMFTPRAQRLGDLLAGTYCERVRIRPVPSADLVLPAHLQAWAQIADVSRMPDPLARKLWQFAHEASAMQLNSRARIAADLMAQAAPFVHPLPPADPVSSVVGVVIVRRDREYRALSARAARSAALLTATMPTRAGNSQR